MRNLRSVQTSDKTRIEPDLVLTRIGDLGIRNVETLIRGMLYRGQNKDAVILSGLIATPRVSGLTLDVEVPAIGAQMIDGDDIRFFLDFNNDADYAISLDTAETTGIRTDIIEARVKRSDAFADNTIYIANPETKTVSPATRYRDYKYHLEIRKKTGTAGGPPPTTTAATRGTLTGTVAIATTIDLSLKYILCILIGTDGEWVEVDCRGSVPALTSLAEIIDALNNAGFGTIATNDGSNHLVLTAPGYGENSIIRIKEPLDETIDCYDLILGGVLTTGYRHEFKGENKWFKVTEITVPQNATSISEANVKTILEKSSWVLEGDLIVNGKSLEDHRDSDDMDHIDGSVKWRHLSEEVRLKTSQRFTEYRGPYARLYPVDGDSSYQKATLFKNQNIEVCDQNKNTQDIDSQEQKYPVSRIDQKQEVYSSNYNALTSLSESSVDKVSFNPSSGVLFSLNHSRIGVYVKTIGSGYTHLRLEIHDTFDTDLGHVDIPIGSLSVGWNYGDITVTLVAGSTYHYHAYMIGFTSGTTIILGSDGSDFSFRELFRPDSGKYGDSTYGEDVVKLLDVQGNSLVPVRSSGSDVGYIATGYDFVSVDLSNDAVWASWEYNDFIGLDLATGRIKLPASLRLDLNIIYAEFNVVEGIDSIDTKNVMMHGSGESLADYLENREDDLKKTFYEQSKVDELFLGLRQQLDQERNINLAQELKLSYMLQRLYQQSKMLIEPYFNEDYIKENYETSSNKPAEIMDDNDWNNNWKQRADGSPDFKNGFMRQRKQSYMLEVIDEFDLSGVGQAYKCSIKYDSVNNCYWFISNAGANAVGQISKLSINMKDGKVEEIAKWYIPASGASTNYWTGIAVNDAGNKLFIVLYGGSSSTASKVYGLAINSDGTLGATGYTKKSGETIDLTNSIFASRTITNAGYDTGYYNDAFCYDSNDIMVVCANGATAVSLISLKQSDLSAGTASNITGLVKYLGGTESSHITVCKHGSDLYFRMDDWTGDKRFIQRINLTSDIVSNVCIKTSGRWDNTRNVDGDGYAWGGVCIGHHGDLLEVVATASYGKFIARRSLKNALWAENQVCGEYKCNASTNPSIPVALYIEDDRYYWTADYNVANNECDVYRFDTQTGTFLHVRCVNAGWGTIQDISGDGTNLVFITWDATNQRVWHGLKSTFLSTMGESYIPSINLIDWAAWATEITGTTISERKHGICYDSDNSLYYVANSGTNKIDTINSSWTYTAGVYALPSSSYIWKGIAYNNGNIYLQDHTEASTPCRIYVLPLNKQTASKWWRGHIYQDPAPYFTAGGSQAIDFHGNDIVTIHYTQVAFYRMKILDDPDVFQLHTFIDSNNILLSSNVQCLTPIVERYFKPKDYSDLRDCPDKNYCALGYGDDGFSILHLDAYLSGKSSTGKDRYDVRNITTWHYKKSSGSSVSTANIISGSGSSGNNVQTIIIEKDMIITGHTDWTSTFYNSVVVIDLKAGTALTLGRSGESYTGLYYAGTLSERNDGKGYIGSNNHELDVAGNNHNKLHAVTFTKDDASPYNGANPKTFVAIGTDAGCCLLVLDWDANGNRTPVKVWNNIFNAATLGSVGIYITQEGKLIVGDYAYSGGLYVIAEGANPGFNNSKFNPYIWEINSHTIGYQYLCGTASLTHGYVWDISPNSPCIKTPSGTWRNRLLVSTLEGEGAGVSTLCIVDIENSAKENIIYHDSGVSIRVADCDINEDRVFAVSNRYEGYLYSSLGIYKKLRFDDKVDALVFNNWQASGHEFSNADSIYTYSYRPSFTAAIRASGYGKGCRYSSSHNILHFSHSNAGLQLFHFPVMDGCTMESEDFDCDNPQGYHYIKSAILPGGEKCSQISRTSGVKDIGTIAYTNGDDKNWTEDSTNNWISLDKATTTQGYVEWTGITGVSRAGIFLLMAQNAGKCKLTVTKTNGTTETIINGQVVDLFQNNATDQNHCVLWVDLLAENTYTVKLEHNGNANASATDELIKVRGFLAIQTLNPAEVQEKLVLAHSDHSGYSEEYDLVEGAGTEISKTVEFVANGTDDTFVLSDSGDRVAAILAFGVKASGASEITWYITSDPDLQWGSNSPGYDDKIIDSSDHIGVRFDSPPPAGSVYIKFVPKANQYHLETTLKQPYLGTYIETRAPMSLLDKALELY